MDTEGIAVHAVEAAFMTSDRVKTYVDKNDRTPITDGHIDIHSGSPFTNKNLVGRVTVQVKGKAVDNGCKLKGTETYAIKRAVLQGFLHSRGVVFFLVLINKKRPGSRTIYYAPLTPFRIMELLDEMEHGQSKKTIHLKRLPKQPRELVAILTFAIQSQKESPDLGFDWHLFEDIEELTLYSDTKVNLDRPLVLDYMSLNHSLMLRTTTGLMVPVPGQMKLYPAAYVERGTDLVIRSGEFTFRNPSVKRIEENFSEFKLSDGLNLHIPDDMSVSGGKINLSLRNSVGGRHQDIGFFIACIDTGAYSVNRSVSRFDATGLEAGGELRAHFEYLDRICTLFRALEVDPFLVEFSEISEHRSEQLGGLYQAIVERKEFDEKLEKPGRILQPLGKWFLELICVQDKDSGAWRYYSLFSPELARQFLIMEAGEGSPESRVVRITPYEAIEEKRFPFTLNLNLERVVDAYAQIIDHPETSTRANYMVLRLINAADKVEQRREEFLDAADRLNEWLIEREGELPHHAINRWQNLERRGELSDQHRAAIRALRRSAAASEINLPQQAAFCCSVLLSDIEEANDSLAALSDEERESIQSWPIWSLYRMNLKQIELA